MKSFNQKKFDTIVRQYKSLRKKSPDTHIDFCIQQKALPDTINAAARSIDENNKIHSHQRRIGKIKLDKFAEQLKQKETEIKKTKTFDELLTIIEEVKFEGIAALTKYDVATRIGAYLNLFPNKIYLHAGTRIGAINLLGNFNK